MLFDTPVYFLFLALIVGLYWKLPFRQQNVLLLCGSYFFYGWWDWRFLFLMAGSTLVDYFLANTISKASNPATRKACLTISLTLNFAFLGVFKYFNFFIDSFSHVSGWFGYASRPFPLLEIALPAGISFYTFQAVAYIVDVYFGKLKPSRSLLDYALFISLFPHLVAGPIQRPSHLLPQVEKPRAFDAESFFDGLMLIVTGLFRKCVIADNCALIVNSVFGGGFGEWSAPTALLGVYAFAWQIYGDFSGYSDIARGSAQLLGFHFMVNFKQPYLSTNLSDFWQRWHVSLSTWLRDYLYIPLGGNRQGTWKMYRNLITTMLLGGLWHGANWTFVIWGALHGAGLVFQRLLGWDDEGTKAATSMVKSASWRLWVRRIVVFHFVCLAWIFFRAANTQEAVHYLAAFGKWGTHPQLLSAWMFLASFSIPLALLDLRLYRTGEEYPFQKLTSVGDSAAYSYRVATAAVLLSVVIILGSVSSSAFIYFQF